MTQDDTPHVPYQRLVDHFDRPLKSPMERFDPDELPEGEPRELYDKVMAEYYSHLPIYPARLIKEKTKFDLLTRAKQNSDDLAQKAQAQNAHEPQILEEITTKELSVTDVRQILGPYRAGRKLMPTADHPSTAQEENSPPRSTD